MQSEEHGGGLCVPRIPLDEAVLVGATQCFTECSTIVAKGDLDGIARLSDGI